MARKLLEFPEALERDNYTQAVAREQFIPYQELKQLVSRLSSRIVPGAEQAQPREEFSPRERKKEKEDGARQSQRLLLTWLIEDPKLFDKIEGIITPDDFREDLYHQVAQMVFDTHATGEAHPRSIINQNKTAEEQETVSETVGMPNPWTDCKNLNEAEDNVGFSITVPEKIDGYTRTMIQTLDKEVIQVFYEKDDQSDSTILIRKGIGSDDISGDYNTYNEKTQLNINKNQIMEQGNDGKVMLATWTDAGYTYSVSTPGLSESEMENIIHQIE